MELVVNISRKMEKGRTISTLLTDTAFFHPHDSKGEASCVPPKKH
jgi:hypothetical protein